MNVGNIEGLGPYASEELVESLDEFDRFADIGRRLKEARKQDDIEAQKAIVKELGGEFIYRVSSSHDGTLLFGVTAEDNRFDFSMYGAAEGLEAEGWRPPVRRTYPTEDGDYVFLANSLEVNLQDNATPGEIYAYALGHEFDGREGVYDARRCKIGELTTVNLFPTDQLPELVIPRTTEKVVPPPRPDNPLPVFRNLPHHLQ